MGRGSGFLGSGHRATRDKRVQGQSYPQAWYEDTIGELLDHTISEVVRRHPGEPAAVDRAALVRIARNRDDAGPRLAQTRDVLAWQREMATLDAEEEAAGAATEPERLSPQEVVA